MKRTISFFATVFLSSCTLFSPCVITIKNQSAYTITVSSSKTSTVISIEKKKQGHFETLPGKQTVYIKASGQTSSQEIDACYMENIEIIYSLSD